MTTRMKILMLITMGFCFVLFRAQGVTITASADTYVADGSLVDTKYGTGTLLRCQHYNTNSKVYMRFSLSSAPAPRTNATLTLTTSGWATNNTATFNVYGLRNGTAGDAANGWNEATITWNNAPANDTASVNGFLPDAVPLGSFTFTSATGNGDTVTFSSPELITFLNSDTNYAVTIMLSRVDPYGYQSSFVSKEGSNGPTLTIDSTGTHSFTTRDAGGDDSYVKDSMPNTSYGSSVEIAVKNAPGAFLKGYLRFNLSAMSQPANLTYAALALTTYNFTTGTPLTFDVYGMRNGTAGDAANGWNETTITWNNAPANNTSSATGFTSDAVYLGSFTFTAAATGGETIYFSSPDLLNFLKNDGNQQVTLMLSREQYGSVLNSSFCSAESASTPPALSVNVAPMTYFQITTASGTGGADSYVNDGSLANNNYGGSSAVAVKAFGSAGSGGNRKGYMRFDRSLATQPVLTDASLTLTTTQWPTNAPYRFDVYGLLDGAAGDTGSGWDEYGITWNNAPANNFTSTNGFTSDAAYLGSFNCISPTGSGDIVRFTSPDLLNFLQQDTNGKVTIMLARNTYGSGASSFCPKEYGPPAVLSIGGASAPVNPAPWLNTNKTAWTAKATTNLNNPFLELNKQMYASVIGAFSAPALNGSATPYVVQNLIPVAYAAGDTASPYRGRSDLVAYAKDAVSWIVNGCNSGGYWWSPTCGLIGDCNTNRFVLAPLLDAIRWLRSLNDSSVNTLWVNNWRPKLDAAVAFQRSAYAGQVWWDRQDWGGGHYANMDAYYSLIMALSSDPLLFNNSADLQSARTMVGRIQSNLLPDGGIHYYFNEPECPIYHALDLYVLARYKTLTGDSVAQGILAATANYYPLTMTAEGQIEQWSDSCWKHYNLYAPSLTDLNGLVVAAGATGDARNQWLLWNYMQRLPVPPTSIGTTGIGMSGIYCAPYWTGTAPGTAIADSFVLNDGNIRGIRIRSGQWYCGLSQGWGLRDSFVGGTMTDPLNTPAVLTAFRGAHLHVLTASSDYTPSHNYFLSEDYGDDYTGMALHPNVSAGAGVRYTLQKSPSTGTSPTPLQVTQVWHAAGDGMIGLVSLKATAAVTASDVAGEILLGPAAIVDEGNNQWRCGPLRVKLLKSFGAVSITNTPCATTVQPKWPTLELKQTVAGGTISSGTQYSYAVWVGPASATPPANIQLLSNDMGWVASWEHGRNVAAVFNPGTSSQLVSIPWAAPAPTAWINESGGCQILSVTSGAVSLTLSAGECAIVENSVQW